MTDAHIELTETTVLHNRLIRAERTIRTLAKAGRDLQGQVLRLNDRIILLEKNWE